MNAEQMKRKYQEWLEYAVEDEDIVRELHHFSEDPGALSDAFYRDLSFGTGGLRGVIGAGTNRMNIYTVARASQGLAAYVKRRLGSEMAASREKEGAEGTAGDTAKTAPRIAVSYDSRLKSKLFAEVAAGVFAANGLEVFIYPELMPTPCLSFAVRTLSCAAGIMVTASHNPSKYNGYKVYRADGCQITTEAAEEILYEIEKVDPFKDVKRMDFAEGISSGRISYIGDEVVTDFIEHVKAQTMLEIDEAVDKTIRIVYSPLNGTGLKPVTRTLMESGYTNITVVKEQEQPDGHFPTCPYPNPEIREAMELGLKYAAECNADLLLTTDPDCDRVGIAVQNENGEYALLSGNETGMLLLDYICSRRRDRGRMPENPVMVKTIVTIDMAERIARSYGVDCINVLTGFKYIGEQIGLLEKDGRADSYIFGFEESYGYLSGSYVRDKDAVDGAFLICEMTAFYRARGLGLWERLQELYREYGYCRNTLHSYSFEGAAGFERMQRIMESLRRGLPAFGSKKTVRCLDYSEGLDGLPRADVLKFILEDHCSVVIRPSGTEPKLKAYISVSAANQKAAEQIEKEMVRALERNMGELG